MVVDLPVLPAYFDIVSKICFSKFPGIKHFSKLNQNTLYFLSNFSLSSGVKLSTGSGDGVGGTGVDPGVASVFNSSAPVSSTIFGIFSPSSTTLSASPPSPLFVSSPSLFSPSSGLASSWFPSSFYKSAISYAIYIT